MSSDIVWIIDEGPNPPGVGKTVMGPRLARLAEGIGEEGD